MYQLNGESLNDVLYFRSLKTMPYLFRFDDLLRIQAVFNVILWFLQCWQYTMQEAEREAVHDSPRPVNIAEQGQGAQHGPGKHS